MGRRSKYAFLQRRHTEGQKDTWEDAQHHYSSGKHKSKPLRYHLISVRMAVIKKNTNKCWWEENPHTLLVGM